MKKLKAFELEDGKTYVMVEGVQVGNVYTVAHEGKLYQVFDDGHNEESMLLFNAVLRSRFIEVINE